MVSLWDLRRGNVKTCGDSKKHPKLWLKRDIAFVPGTVYGKLTLMDLAEISITPGGRNIPKMLCECECGNTKVVGLWDLQSGKTKTCGVNHPFYDDRSDPAFNSYYNHTYKAAAAKRGLSFELSMEEFRTMTQQECFYCGTPPSRNIKCKTGTHTSIYVANGIDRVDNQIGYVMTNVVPCCFDCNHAKATLSQKQFLELANKVAQRHPVMVD
jgi:hypothetical protein